MIFDSSLTEATQGLDGGPSWSQEDCSRALEFVREASSVCHGGVFKLVRSVHI